MNLNSEHSKPILYVLFGSVLKMSTSFKRFISPMTVLTRAWRIIVTKYVSRFQYTRIGLYPNSNFTNRDFK